MQQKRKAQESFVHTASKPRLSAFAAARAKASTAIKSPSQDDVVDGVVGNQTRKGVIADHGSLPTFLSSFPLSKSQELDDASSDNSDDSAANFSDDDGNYSRAYSSSAKASQPIKLSSLGPEKYSVISDQPDRLSLKLEPEETVTFVGEYDLQVVTGIVMVYGAILRPSTKTNRIYAPSTHALPVITAKGGVAEIAVISTGPSLDKLAKISPLWTKLWHGQSSKDGSQKNERPSRSFALLRSSTDDPLKRAVTPLEVEHDIQITLSRVLNKPTATNPSSVIMVSGPKASGKSTICKWLVNTFLTASKATASTSCFWLDLDPGQPEFSAPGQMSLVQIRTPVLGPNYTHPSGNVASAYRTIRSHTLCANMPKEDVSHFINCAADLRDEYFRMLEEFEGAPLILNCSGWVLGSAVSVMMDLVQQFPLTDVVLMQPMEQETIASLEATLPTAKVVTIPPRTKPAQSRTSAELRAMQTMSYFHSMEPQMGLSIWTDMAVSEFQPWHVKYSGEDSGISSIISYGEAINPDFLAMVIDGMLLAVCVVESDEAYATVQYRPAHLPNASAADMGEDMSDRIGRTPEGIPYLLSDNAGLIQPLDPRFSSCKGLALVRGIDVEKQELHLLTPMSPLEIKRLEGSKTVLVRGKFDSPDWALLEDIYNGAAQRMTEQQGFVNVKNKTFRPYVSERDTEAGLGGNVWRVRHLPRRQTGGGGGGGGGGDGGA